MMPPMVDDPQNAPTERRKFIGGSDAAAIIGHSRWKTPLRVYFEKRGEPVPNSEIDPALEALWRRGKRMEPVIVDTLIDEYGIKVVRRSMPGAPNRYVDAEFPFLGAEIDFEWEVQKADIDRWGLPGHLLGKVQNGEAKSVHQFAAAQFGEPESDEIPIEYGAQAAHGQMVRGPDRIITLFSVMIGVQLYIYMMRRDDETIAGLRRRSVSFWKNNVLAGVPPEPVNLPDIMLLFHRSPAITVEADNEIAKKVEELIEARDAATAAQERAEDLKFEIGKFMLGEANIERDHEDKVRPVPDAKLPLKHVLTWKGLPLLNVAFQTSNRIDLEKLRTEFVEVAAACGKQSSSFVFRRPKKGTKR